MQLLILTKKKLETVRKFRIPPHISTHLNNYLFYAHSTKLTPKFARSRRPRRGCEAMGNAVNDGSSRRGLRGLSTLLSEHDGAFVGWFV